MAKVNVKESYRQSGLVLKGLSEDPQFIGNVKRAAERCIRAIRSGRKILAFGNGGSAADAQHFACELVGRFERERRALPVVCLNTNVSILTSIGNDYGYEKVFERQVEALGVKGDVVLAISTSGKSANVNRALRLAGRLGLFRISLNGKTGGEMSALAEIDLKIPATTTAHTQEAHTATIHILCDLIEEAFESARSK